jgi:hypothetical protein
MVWDRAVTQIEAPVVDSFLPRHAGADMGLLKLATRLFGHARCSMVPSTGVEPVTYRLGGDCSILLSYGGKSGSLEKTVSYIAISGRASRRYCAARLNQSQVLSLHCTLRSTCSVLQTLRAPMSAAWLSEGSLFRVDPHNALPESLCENIFQIILKSVGPDRSWRAPPHLLTTKVFPSTHDSQP